MPDWSIARGYFVASVVDEASGPGCPGQGWVERLGAGPVGESSVFCLLHVEFTAEFRPFLGGHRLPEGWVPGKALFGKHVC